MYTMNMKERKVLYLSPINLKKLAQRKKDLRKQAKKDGVNQTPITESSLVDSLITKHI